MVPEVPLAAILVPAQGRSSADAELQQEQHGKSDCEKAADHERYIAREVDAIVPDIDFPWSHAACKSSATLPQRLN